MAISRVYIVAQSTQPVTSSKQDGTNCSLLDPGFVPLWQTLVWIVFWAVLLAIGRICYNKQAGELFSVFTRRMRQGAALKVGGFIELDAPPEIKDDQAKTATAEGTTGVEISKELDDFVLDYEKNGPGIAEEVYLVHEAEVIQPKTARNNGQYRVRVWLEAYGKTEYDSCLSVIYRLHETLKPQVIATEAKENQFELWLNIWGEFTVIAYVDRKDKPSVWVTRYLDLPGRPPD